MPKEYVKLVNEAKRKYRDFLYFLKNKSGILLLLLIGQERGCLYSKALYIVKQKRVLENLISLKLLKVVDLNGDKVLLLTDKGKRVFELLVELYREIYERGDTTLP